MRPRTTPSVTLAAALAAGALIGAGGGAATYAALSSGKGQTVVRQVTVNDSQPTSSGGNLSVQSVEGGGTEIRAQIPLNGNFLKEAVAYD